MPILHRTFDPSMQYRHSIPHTTSLDGACVITGRDGSGACGSGRGRLRLDWCVEPGRRVGGGGGLRWRIYSYMYTATPLYAVYMPSPIQTTKEVENTTQIYAVNMSPPIQSTKEEEKRNPDICCKCATSNTNNPQPPHTQWPGEKGIHHVHLAE